MKAGAVMVPVNVFYQAADAAYVVQNSGATVLITDEEHLPWLSTCGRRASR